MLIDAAISEPRLRYVQVSSFNQNHHDTTLVFDIATGDWAVINSLSLTKKVTIKQVTVIPSNSRKYVA